MPKKNARKSGAKSVKSLPAKPVGKDESKVVRGGDAAAGLPTGKRMHKPYAV